MTSKWLLLPASLICGLIGGILSREIVPDRRKSATFERVVVTKDLLVAPNATTEKGCRILPDGTITATGGVIAGQVRSNVLIGNSILASLNATQQSLNNQQIAVEITANSDRGGELILRSAEGVFCPAQGIAAKGHMTCLSFNPYNQTPSIFTQDLSHGEQGRAFVICAKPKPAQPEQETAKQAFPQPPQQPFRK